MRIKIRIVDIEGHTRLVEYYSLPGEVLIVQQSETRQYLTIRSGGTILAVYNINQLREWAVTSVEEQQDDDS